MGTSGRPLGCRRKVSLIEGLGIEGSTHRGSPFALLPTQRGERPQEASALDLPFSQYPINARVLSCLNPPHLHSQCSLTSARYATINRGGVATCRAGNLKRKDNVVPLVQGDLIMDDVFGWREPSTFEVRTARHRGQHTERSASPDADLDSPGAVSPP